jgi:hypothetical protein
MAPAYEARDAKVASHARAAYAHAVRHGASSSAIVIADHAHESAMLDHRAMTDVGSIHQVCGLLHGARDVHRHGRACHDICGSERLERPRSLSQVALLVRGVAGPKTLSAWVIALPKDTQYGVSAFLRRFRCLHGGCPGQRVIEGAQQVMRWSPRATWPLARCGA